MSASLINAFEVPAEADEPFIAGWRRARDFLARRQGFGATALHRALRPDADFRFVNVARVDSVPAWQAAIADPEFPGQELPFPAHPGLYEAVHEDGAPDGSAGVVLINPFELAAESDGEFLEGWRDAGDRLAAQPGYLGTRLHRSLGPADFRFVNVARWSSPLAFAKALRHVAPSLPFRAHPSLYVTVRE